LSNTTQFFDKINICNFLILCSAEAPASGVVKVAKRRYGEHRGIEMR